MSITQSSADMIAYTRAKLGAPVVVLEHEIDPVSTLNLGASAAVYNTIRDNTYYWYTMYRGVRMQTMRTYQPGTVALNVTGVTIPPGTGDVYQIASNGNQINIISYQPNAEGGASVYAFGPAPIVSYGTLNKISGNGDATITFDSMVLGIPIDPGHHVEHINDTVLDKGVKESLAFYYEFPDIPMVLFQTSTEWQSKWADFFLQIRQWKQMSKIYSIDYDWREVDQNLVITPVPSTESVTALIDYSVTLDDTLISKLHVKEYYPLREYFLADTMEILATVRGKYPSYPVAGGEMSFADVDDMRTRAREMKDKLSKDLVNLFEPIPMIML